MRAEAEALLINLLVAVNAIASGWHDRMTTGGKERARHVLGGERAGPPWVSNGSGGGGPTGLRAGRTST